MIETGRFKNDVIFIQTILSLVLSRKIINRDTVSRSLAQALLNDLSNFPFIATLVVTSKIFDFSHSDIELLQAKSNDVVVVSDLIASLIDLISNAKVNIDFLFAEWYMHALELLQKVCVDETMLFL